MTRATLETLLADVKTLVTSAEELLDTTAHDVSTAATGVRERTQQALQSAKTRLQDLEAAAEAKVRAGAREADRYVHDHPWTSIGLGAAVGVLIGLLIGRRER